MMGEWCIIPSRPLYEASSDGEIRRVGSAGPLRAHIHADGYARVSLWAGGIGKTKAVHRLVCEAFHGSPPCAGLDVAHGKGNRSDNRSANVRWATRAENEADKVAMGLANIGERNGQSRLTVDAVQEIRRRHATAPRSSGGARVRKGVLAGFAAEFGVARSCISSVVAGRLWSHVA